MQLNPVPDVDTVSEYDPRIKTLVFMLGQRIDLDETSNQAVAADLNTVSIG